MIKIDLGQPFDDFNKNIDEAIFSAVKEKATIPLPVDVSIDTIVLVLSQVDCSKCDGICCRATPSADSDSIALHPSEYECLNSSPEVHKTHIKFPCPFQKGSMCTIYTYRPLVCVMYPIQPGGKRGHDSTMSNKILALDSKCPESQRIARNIYLSLWHFYRAQNRIKKFVLETKK